MRRGMQGRGKEVIKSILIPVFCELSKFPPLFTSSVAIYPNHLIIYCLLKGHACMCSQSRLFTPHYLLSTGPHLRRAAQSRVRSPS